MILAQAAYLGLIDEFYTNAALFYIGYFVVCTAVFQASCTNIMLIFTVTC